jgi:hypothetical protein
MVQVVMVDLSGCEVNTAGWPKSSRSRDGVPQLPGARVERRGDRAERDEHLVVGRELDVDMAPGLHADDRQGDGGVRVGREREVEHVGVHDEVDALLAQVGDHRRDDAVLVVAHARTDRVQGIHVADVLDEGVQITPHLLGAVSAAKSEIDLGHCFPWKVMPARRAREVCGRAFTPISGGNVAHA